MKFNFQPLAFSLFLSPLFCSANFLKLGKRKMENTQVLDMIAGGLAIVVFIGGMLMMYTTVFTTKKNK
jgi:hypothetical protein